MSSAQQGWLTAGSVSAAKLADDLSLILGRPVIDKTGFPAPFDIRLEFKPDQVLAGVRTPGSYPPASGALFTALQNQLGLKLELVRSPVEILLIDHVEKPQP